MCTRTRGQHRTFGNICNVCATDVWFFLVHTRVAAHTNFEYFLVVASTTVVVAGGLARIKNTKRLVC